MAELQRDYDLDSTAPRRPAKRQNTWRIRRVEPDNSRPIENSAIHALEFGAGDVCFYDVLAPEYDYTVLGVVPSEDQTNQRWILAELAVIRAICEFDQSSTTDVCTATASLQSCWSDLAYLSDLQVPLATAEPVDIRTATAAALSSLRNVLEGQHSTPHMAGALNPGSSPLISELQMLAAKHPSMLNQIRDAMKFAVHVPFGLRQPLIWVDDENEIVFEWRFSDRHAVVSFEGDGVFGYALLKGDRFVPGQHRGDLNSPLPSDLASYLSRK